MIIANKKKKENIAEYILYMWQVEDIIRANQFDINKLEKNIINQFDQPNEVKVKIKEWYNMLMKSMKEENILESGHLKFVGVIVDDLNKLHLEILKSDEHKEYKEQYKKTLPNIKELQNRSENSISNDIDTCFIGLYALLLMRLQGREITTETNMAISTFSKLLAYLSKQYKELNL